MKGNAVEALPKYRLNQKLVTPLAAADPQNVDLQVELGFAYARLGHAFSQEQNEKEGLANLGKALVIFNSLVRRTGYSQARHGLASSHTWMGQLFESKGKMARASEHYRQARDEFLALTSAMPWDQYHQAGLAGSHRVIGRALFAMGKPKEAEQEYHKGIEIAEPLVRTRPGNVLAWSTLADLYFGLGEVSRFSAMNTKPTLPIQRLHWLAAHRYYQQSLDAWRHVPSPGKYSSTGFDCGSPIQVAQALAQADAAIHQVQRELPSKITNPKREVGSNIPASLGAIASRTGAHAVSSRARLQ